MKSYAEVKFVGQAILEIVAIDKDRVTFRIDGVDTRVGRAGDEIEVTIRADKLVSAEKGARV